MTVSDLEVRRAQGDDDMRTVRSIREAVFIREQSVPADREWDGLDNECEHFLCILSGVPVGCGRVRSMDGYHKIERLAVLGRFRGKGVGNLLIRRMIEACRDDGATTVVIHAQLRTENYYRRFGFVGRGGVFSDAGIDHREMILSTGDGQS